MDAPSLLSRSARRGQKAVERMQRWSGKVGLAWQTRREIKAAAAGLPRLHGLRLGRPLMVKEERGIFAGTLDGRDVVIKIIRRPERAQASVASTWTALTRAHAHMSQGPHQVPEPILAAPEKGILVMAHAPGTRLTEILQRASQDRAFALTRHAADWLARYTAPGRESGVLAAGFWASNRGRDTANISEPDLRRLGGHLAVTLKMQAARLQNVPVERVHPHADFWSHNLIWDGAVMTGVDLAVEKTQPLSRDVARFLVHQSVLLPAPRGPWRYGLPAHWVQAFEAAPLLREEVPGVLRFFVGIVLHQRLLVASTATPNTLRKTVDILERYVSSPD